MSHIVYDLYTKFTDMQKSSLLFGILYFTVENILTFLNDLLHMAMVLKMGSGDHEAEPGGQPFLLKC